MQSRKAHRAHWVELGLGFDKAAEKLPDALSREGFGIVTTIDLAATFKAKLGVDFRRYRIFGACNPKFAFEATSQDPEIGSLLPCNVVLYERDDERAVLGVIDPIDQLGAVDDPRHAETAKVVGEKLGRVLAAMAEAR